MMSRDLINSQIDCLNKFNNFYAALLNSNDLIEYEVAYSKLNKILPNKLGFKFKYLLVNSLYREYKSLYYDSKHKVEKLKYIVEEHNKEIIAKEIEIFKSTCGTIEGKELDNQQIDAIIRKNKNQLVIAGAGSGKTTTIIGKVKYLLKTKQANPEDILLLSFTNASAEEMKERIKKETNVDLDVFTFHKLGLNIIKKSIGKNVKIYDKDLYSAIKKIIESLKNEPSYFNKLLYFMSTARFNIKDEFDFKTENEYNDYLLNNKPTTLKGETVKSYGELEIANYLFINSINYEYEREYEYDTMTDEYNQYTPDFYLPEYGIYIEYFGIDEKGNVAPFIKSVHGKNPSDEYNESIKWKRSIHKKNNTKLIELYYYEKKDNKLIEKLEEELKRNNVIINPKSNDEIWEKINENNAGISSEISRVFETIINLIKSNNYSFSYLYSLETVKESKLNILTLDLIKPIYEAYNKILVDNNMIDFNDMINMATLCVNNNEYIHNYKYVIVDEYQDISNSRYRLLSALRNQNDYSLFCVGDDWQSIYRFNGSDIDLITNFEKYWGKTYISFMEKTYRFTSMMSELSGNFIMKNPNQYRKKINAKMSEDFAISFINGYTETNCIDFLGDKLYRLEKNSTVFFLGRYSFDIDMFKNNADYIIKFNPSENASDITYVKRKDLKIRFITVHRSKGLQADYVVILNNKNYGMGFPSKINDLPIMHLLLGNGTDDYLYSEERRLFYVALTRAKKKTYLLAINKNKSCFINELEKDYKALMKNDKELKTNIYTCPKCGGRLIPRKGPYSNFMGCSNYPKCKYIKRY